MWSLAVVVGHKAVDSDSGISWCLVGVGINILVFDSSPQSFHEDIVIRSATMIHTDLCSSIQKKGCKLWAGEMTSLVTIHDLRLRYIQSFPAGIQDKVDLHAVIKFPVEIISREPVDNCHKIQPVVLDGDIGDIIDSSFSSDCF